MIGKHKKRALLFILTMLMICSFSACKKNQDSNGDDIKPTQQELSFDEYMNQLLVEDLTSDLTTYYQYVENAADFNITEYNKKLTGPGKASFDERISKCEQALATLKNYDYDSLTDEQKLTYDTLKTNFEQMLEVRDCCYYFEPLSTLDGDHVVLPGIVGLEVSRFFESMNNRNVKDVSAVKEYFTFYEAIGDYFKEVAQFEREKKEQGLFMSKNRASSVLSVCKEQIDNECKEISSSFEEELEKQDWISDADKASLIEENESKVKEFVVSGYQALYDAMKECAKDAGEEKALCETKLGKKFYAYVIKSELNKDVTPEQMIETLEEYVPKWTAEQQDITAKNPSIMASINKKLRDYTDIDILIDALNKGAKADFPELDISWGIKDMPQSMNGFAMGLFFPQALDSTTKNHFIYAGTLLSPGESSYVQTVAHEGVPGHLYNFCYWAQRDMCPYRRFAGWNSGLGTLEGWTTYIEEYGYKYIGLSDDEARYLELNRLLELGTIQRVDAGINYEGWKLQDVTDYLMENKPEYALMGEYITGIVQDSINAYGPYGLGYIYLTQIKEDMMKKKGDSYTDLDFHTDYLNVGPTTFDLIRKQLLGE